MNKENFIAFQFWRTRKKSIWDGKEKSSKFKARKS